MVSNNELTRIYHEMRKNNELFRIAKRGINNSLLDVKQQIKYVNLDACKEVVNPLTGKVEMLLSGEYVKFCLQSLYPPFNQNYKLARKTYQIAPLYYNGAFLDREMVYIDIKSCYYQLYKKLWLDFCVPQMKPPKGIPLLDIAEITREWKAARNSVMGYLASDSICNVTGKKWRYINIAKSKKFFNPCILHCVNLMLHELATFALNNSCIYINTDGYFFLKNSPYIKMMKLLDNLGLEFRAIMGNGSIVKFNGYTIDGISLRGEETHKHTKFFDKVPQRYLDNIITPMQKDNLVVKFHFPIFQVDKQNDLSIIKWWSKL